MSQAELSLLPSWRSWPQEQAACRKASGTALSAGGELLPPFTPAPATCLEHLLAPLTCSCHRPRALLGLMTPLGVLGWPLAPAPRWQTLSLPPTSLFAAPPPPVCPLLSWVLAPALFSLFLSLPGCSQETYKSSLTSFTSQEICHLGHPGECDCIRRGGHHSPLHSPPLLGPPPCSFLPANAPPQAAGLTLHSRCLLTLPTDPSHDCRKTCCLGLCPQRPDPSALREMLPNPPSSMFRTYLQILPFSSPFLISKPQFPSLSSGDKSGIPSQGCWGSDELISGTQSPDIQPISSRWGWESVSSAGGTCQHCGLRR